MCAVLNRSGSANKSQILRLNAKQTKIFLAKYFFSCILKWPKHAVWYQS